MLLNLDKKRIKINLGLKRPYSKIWVKFLTEGSQPQVKCLEYGGVGMRAGAGGTFGID